ncbi:methionyl-tRNA formyltransferase [Oceanospirillum linum]|uniref:Methionyl-tRNA formyltransferase n=1 Tax=Oceanospirillum linum TaxID=966 RepID=A0A1T1HFK2_OCELI|nr:methionyl-tRNA formyltransferase [Oceanospirillum linum]OOV88585.1 methionyl-tRNA formyltransferase [Oceanospirillum linum]SEF61774.1 methionyl-tRNA formyltransferase [Oleiphilus messinensis]SMP07297.1 methionyl-tRNA formyltransferase [Oceanospirillum linum]
MDYLVAAVGEWNKSLFELNSKKLEGSWYFVSTPDELNSKLEKGLKPRYIFFPHWRWIVPENILNQYECVCFHMTDVPYGRGGSPLQNLIIRGHQETILTALKMEKSLDTGPVYFKKPLTLAGTAHEIYVRASKLTWEIIKEMVLHEPLPKPQAGDPVVFNRRKPSQSEIEPNLSLEQLYDHIRMLDAPNYPKAFLNKDSYYLEFQDAKLEGNELVATVKIQIKR